MRNVLILALVAFVAWYGYSHYQRRSQVPSESSQATPFESSPADTSKCDGRTRCSQMTSCEEATYFLKNCPNTTMDGDHDGIPCEQHWCH
jgi:hypothetical protein